MSVTLLWVCRQRVQMELERTWNQDSFWTLVGLFLILIGDYVF